MADAGRAADDDEACPCLDLALCIGIPHIAKRMKLHFKVQEPILQLRLVRLLRELMDAANCCQRDCRMLSLTSKWISKWLQVRSSPAANSLGPRRPLRPLRSRWLPGAARTEGCLAPLSEDAQGESAKEETDLCGPFQRRFQRGLKADSMSMSSRCLPEARPLLTPDVLRLHDESQDSQETVQDSRLEDDLSSTDSDELSSTESKAESDVAEGQRPGEGEESSRRLGHRRAEFCQSRLHAQPHPTAKMAADDVSNAVAEKGSKLADPRPDEISRLAPSNPVDADIKGQVRSLHGEREDRSHLMSVMDYANVMARPPSSLASGQATPQCRGRRLSFTESARPQTIGELVHLSPDIECAGENQGAPASSQIIQTTFSQITAHPETTALFRPFQKELTAEKISTSSRSLPAVRRPRASSNVSCFSSTLKNPRITPDVQRMHDESKDSQTSCRKHICKMGS
eukprot:TRINITY_DN2974_c0_g1_i2.p1 TRINITY_DN2974_c0_g1~~TRINITY_DN2974_c0_g1_i2.p1  ORF type:complete len:457 (-),score=61.71 TRINITY_DN2974_c0_g1_i2:703-2073(-)